MPILPPDQIPARIAPAPTNAPLDVMTLNPRQLAEADWTTQQAWMRRTQAMKEAATRAAEDRVTDQRFNDALLQNARVENAGKAVSAALRFQGMRGFERDRAAAIASGLSEDQASLQALSKNAGRMFADHPGDIAPSMRMMQPPRTVGATGAVPAHVFANGRPWFPPAGSMDEPFEGGKEITTKSGVPLIQTGPKQFRFPPQTGPRFADRLGGLRLRANTLLDELDSLATAANKERGAEIRKELADIRKEIVDLEKPVSAQPIPGGSSFPAVAPAPAVPSPAAGAPSPKAPAAGGYVIIRDKQSRKEFRYPKSLWASEPDDRYELVK